MGHKPPPTLQELALNQCIKHASQIVDLGDTPYRIVKPLLAKLSVDQLLAIEAQCPNLAEQDDEVWSGHISRDFRDRKIPQHNFKETYFAYCRDKEAQLGAARERLKLKQAQYNEQKKAASIVELTEVPVMSRNLGQGAVPFRSQGMQSVARRMQTNAQLRRPQRTQMLANSNVRARNAGPDVSASMSPADSPSNSPPSGASPAAADWQIRAASPPPLSLARASSPTKRPSLAANSVPAKRKRVSSVFMPRK